MSLNAREFFTKVITANVAEDVTAYAKEALTKLDERNAKRRETPNKNQVENEAIKLRILEALANGGKVASELAKVLDTSTQKVSALCTQLVAEGKIAVKDYKAKGKSAVKLYTIIKGE